MRTPEEIAGRTSRGLVSRPAPAAALLLALLFLATGARARTPGPATPKIQPATPAKQPAVKKEIFPDKPDKPYEKGDRVDPFTLGRPKKKPLRKPPPPKNPNGTKVIPQDSWGRELKKVRDEYAKTELVLSAETKDRFTSCMQQCQVNLTSLRSSIQDLRKAEAEKATMVAAKYLNDFLEVLEKFERLAATAKRLQRRQEIEADFAGKKIVVQGIVWRPQSPAAAVNGELVTEGSNLPEVGGKGGGQVRVYRIRKGSVIFLYRGIQVTAHLQRGM